MFLTQYFPFLNWMGYVKQSGYPYLAFICVLSRLFYERWENVRPEKTDGLKLIVGLHGKNSCSSQRLKSVRCSLSNAF